MSSSTLPSSFVNPTPAPCAMYLPTSSWNTRDGECIPSAFFTPSTIPLKKLCTCRLNQPAALHIPFHTPVTILYPTLAICDGSEATPLITALTNWLAAFLPCCSSPLPQFATDCIAPCIAFQTLPGICESVEYTLLKIFDAAALAWLNICCPQFAIFVIALTIAFQILPGSWDKKFTTVVIVFCI